MTAQRVDFYLLNQSVPDGKLRTACRLSKKVVSGGLTAYIRTGDTEQAGRLDDLLWTFEDIGFIPHRLDGDEGDPAPVLIGCAPPRENPPDLLIALGGNMPDHFQVYKRIAEVVDATDEDRRSARQRYKHYKDHGCKLDTHHVNP